MFDIGLVEVGSDGVIDDARFCCQSHHENLSTMRFIIDPLYRFFQTEIVQGTSKKRFPGCVKLGEKVAFCLPTAGRKTQLFHIIFTEPGKDILEVPCICRREIFT